MARRACSASKASLWPEHLTAGRSSLLPRALKVVRSVHLCTPASRRSARGKVLHSGLGRHLGWCSTAHLPGRVEHSDITPKLGSKRRCKSRSNGSSFRKNWSQNWAVGQLQDLDGCKPAMRTTHVVQCCVNKLTVAEQTLTPKFQQLVNGQTDRTPLSEEISFLVPNPGRHLTSGGSASSALPVKIVRTLLIDNYDSYTYNLYQMLAVMNGAPPVIIFNDQMSWDELKPLLVGPSRAFDNVVISPGPGTPERPEDTGVCARIFEQCPQLPVLGVCLGHQVLGHVHGARVTHAPEPVHGRLSELEHAGHPLFAGIPSGAGAGFKVVRYHSLVVDPATLPPHLVPTAWTVPGAQPSSNVQPPASGASAAEILHNSDLHMKTTNGAAKQPTVSTNGAQEVAKSSPQSQQQGEMGLAPSPRTPVSFETKSGPANSNGRNEAPDVAVSGDSVLMGISHRSLPHHGVQFHPESIATAYGERLLRNFYEMTVGYWEGPQGEGKAGEGNGGSQLVNGQHAQRFRSLSESYSLGASWLASAAAAGLPAPQARSREYPERDAPSTLSEEWAVPGASLLQNGEGGVQSSVLPEAASTSSPPPEEGQGRFRVVWKKLPGVVREGSGAEQLFMALYGRAGGEDAFWLDSSSTAAGRGRFSFMGGKGGNLWRKVTYFIGEATGGADSSRPDSGRLVVEDSQGGRVEESTHRSIFDYLEEELSRRRCPVRDTADLPFDFCGGFVGYLGYELKVECGAKANEHQSPFPDAAFFLADKVIAIDHTEGDAYIVEVVDMGQTETETEMIVSKSDEAASLEDGWTVNGDAAAPKAGSDSISQGRSSNNRWGLFSRPVTTDWIERTASVIVDLLEIREMQTLAQSPSSHTNAFPAPASNGSGGVRKKVAAGHADSSAEAQYLEDVRTCMEEIRDGETYEVCLTKRLHPAGFIADPLALYQHLRRVNPAPYSAWLSFGATGPTVACCSPERFLKLDRHGVLEAKPIKGTSPRGADPAEDVRLQEQLRTSPKERAENLMIVDLLRNDLGKVCQVGSVHVPRLMAIESFATVHQLVSTVRGQKRPEVGPLAAVRASFPPGSMTGAPKLRTMEIIDSVERSARGVYSGGLGFFSVNGTFDLNVVIRTATWHEGQVTIGAGGAVVALSDPEAEYAEMLLKGQALLAAVAEKSSLTGLGRAGDANKKS